MDFLYTNFSFLFFFPPTSSSRKYGPFTSGLVSCCRCRCRCCCLVVERESTTTLSADRHFHFHFSHNQQQEIFFNNTGARCEWSFGELCRILFYFILFFFFFAGTRKLINALKEGKPEPGSCNSDALALHFDEQQKAEKREYYYFLDLL